MTNNKFYVINNVAVRVDEMIDKIFIEWYIKTDPENFTFYKLDKSEEIQRMSLSTQNAAIQIQMEIDKNFFGKKQENRYN